jgi:hypothetical protein
MAEVKKQWHVYYMIVGSFYFLLKFVLFFTSDVM